MGLGAVWARWLSGLIGCEWMRVQIEASCLTHLNKPMINVPSTPTPSLAQEALVAQKYLNSVRLRRTDNHRPVTIPRSRITLELQF